jgi:DNA helicase-2/ATP-dependent DNA helicase PcrA
MTIHAAKGLEFKNVFVVGLEENLFPSQLSISDLEELEEERRLFYVALTRAEKRAFLSYANSRFKWGQFTLCEPSRFLEELDDSFLDIQEFSKPKVAPRPGVSFSDSRSSFYEQRNAMHRTSNHENQQKKEPDVPRNLKKIDANQIPSDSSGEWALPSEIRVGVEVLHDKFGKGKVVKIEGESPNEKAVIFFPSEGTKTLLLKFAKLKVVG